MWIAIILATLIITSPAQAQLGGTEAESESAQHEGQAELSAFIRAVVDANPQVNAARAALDASVALEGAAGRPLYNPELEFEAEGADSEVRGLESARPWSGVVSEKPVLRLPNPSDVRLSRTT